MEISISIMALENAITGLKALESDWNGKAEAPPATEGGGKAVQELEAIGRLYQDLHAHLSSLLSGTVDFLRNTKQSYQASDEKAASKISSQ